MKLYLVTCVSHSYFTGTNEECSVYVLANDENAARDDALERMKQLEWKYRDWVSNVKLIASVEPHQADFLLVN